MKLEGWSSWHIVPINSANMRQRRGHGHSDVLALFVSFALLIGIMCQLAQSSVLASLISRTMGLKKKPAVYVPCSFCLAFVLLMGIVYQPVVCMIDNGEPYLRCCIFVQSSEGWLL